MNGSENRGGFISLFLNIKLSKFLYLLISLVLLLIIYPLFEADKLRLELLFIIVIFIFISAIYAISYSRLDFIIGLILAAICILSSLAYLMFPGKYTLLTILISGLVFLIFATLIILYHVLRGEKVTVDTLLGAICVFILIGIIWSGFYLVLYKIMPGSFVVSEAYHYAYDNIRWSALLFYSYSTYTPMSNSAIYPATSYAESVAALEAIFGHLFVVMLIARLVGLYIIREKN